MKGFNKMHTPGPWKLGNDEDFWVPGTCIEGIDPELGMSVVVCDFVHTSADEEEANKRLIMAAPDLLAACEVASIHMIALGNALNWSDDITPEYAEAINDMKAAIAKARGNEE